MILQPMGPVLFVFDVTDTEKLPGALPLPPWVDDPFGVLAGEVGREFEQTIQNGKRDGVDVSERAGGSQRAGSIQVAGPGGYLEVTIAARPQPIVQQVPRRYELILNSKLSREARYATLVHELGHLYCGHRGTPDLKWWPNRSKLSLEIREFEAESVCYLLCTRLGIENPSAEYLAGYVRSYETTPPISLDAVTKASWLIERADRANGTRAAQVGAARRELTSGTVASLLKSYAYIWRFIIRTGGAGSATANNQKSAPTCHNAARVIEAWAQSRIGLVVSRWFCLNFNRPSYLECTPSLRHKTRDWLHRQQLAAAARRPQAVASFLRTRPAADRPGPSAAADDCTRLR